MKKRFKIILSVILPIICITSICLSFLVPKKANSELSVDTQITETDIRRFQANYYAMADESSPAQGQSSVYKGGAVYLEKNSNYTMRGGTIKNHRNTFGGAIFISEGATFTMEGGIITDCSATYGGAIYVSAGGTCNIIAGTITGNTANYGPSIYAEAGAIVNISDDTIIDENSVELNVNVSISTDTIAVGDPSAGLNMYYVDFGSYPQWYVGGDMNTTLEDWYTANTPTSVHTYPVNTQIWQAYEYTDGNIYARGISNPCETSYTYLSGENVELSGDEAWFKVEPIRWIILNYDEYTNGIAENLEIMSYLALTGDIYFNENEEDGNSWESSYIRTWLNDTFYNSAFSSAEQCLMVTTTVGNNITGNYDTETSNTTGIETEDDIYCLSYWDYYNTTGIFTNKNPKRLCSPTDFALSNNCYTYIDKSNVTATCPSGGTCNYWTRSAGTSDAEVLVIGGYGYFGIISVNYNNIGIRPVLQLKI